jgi:hypothetical protein
MQLIEALAPSLIERPKSFVEMTERQHFMAPLDHTLHGLKAVLSDYHFQQKVLCGLKACRKAHNTGFLVVTESGTETNIGQDCGRTHFGAEVFKIAHADHARLRERADLESRARAMQSALPEIAARVDDLMHKRAYGAKWLTAVRREIYGVVGSLFDSLETLQVRRTFEVKQFRQRTTKEIEDLMAVTKGMTYASARYETAIVGVLQPMPWLEFDFKRRLVANLLEPLQRFSLLSPRLTESPKLKERLKQFDGYAKVFDDAEEAAASALRFLADDNLRLVALSFPEHHKAKADALRSWIGSPQHIKLMQG